MSITINGKATINQADMTVTAKLDAIIEAMKAQGWVVNYPPLPDLPDSLPEGWNVLNAIYDNDALAYNGGTIAGIPAFSLDTGVTVGKVVEFQMPTVDFVRLMFLVNQHVSPELNNYPSEFFYSGIGLSGASSVNMNVDGVVDSSAVTFNTNGCRFSAEVKQNGVRFDIYDSEGGYLATHNLVKEFDPELPLYIHLMVEMYNESDVVSVPVSIYQAPEA